MGLLSYFKRQPDAEASAPAQVAAGPEPDAVAAARARARRRLLGATVLLGLGVIGFPLLFETQPRPIAVDIPIEIPRKDGSAALAPPPAVAPSITPTITPTARASAAVVGEGQPLSAAGHGAAERAAAAPAEIVEHAHDAGREMANPASRPPASKPAALVAAKTASAVPAGKAAVLPAPASKPVPPAQAAVSAPAKPAADDGARARALLEGQVSTPPAAAPTASASVSANPAAARLVVQVGAYTDAAKLAEARRKLEALGLKTYTQVVESEAGKRTRVRVGPFASRAEADKAAARVKSAGLPAAILTL